MSAVSVKPHIDRHARRVMHVADAQLKAKTVEAESPESDSGWVEGYAAVWDNVDYQNEVMVKGVFTRSIPQMVKSGKVKLMVRHYRDGGDALECIGTITEAREDDVGLWIHAEFSSTPDAQNIRTKILEKHVRGLSVGYMPVRWEVVTQDAEGNDAEEEIVKHLECILGEVTVTVRPANVLAEITSAKTVSPERLQVTGKSEPADKGKTSVNTPPPPSDLPRIRRDLELKRARLSLLANTI